MKIAVMMSTYNGACYLDKQLQSLAAQTVAEHITVYIRDDGSTDATLAIIKQWRPKLTVKLIEGRNAGPAKSFWSLLTRGDIKADYFAFCDQDDIWDADKLESAIQNLGGGTHLAISNYRVINGDDVVLHSRLEAPKPQISVQRLFLAGVAQGCAMVFTQELRNYIVAKDIQCIPMHDLIVTLYALDFGKIFWQQEPKFGYRVHANNVVAKNNKSTYRRLKTTFWNWKNSSKNSMEAVAKEMLLKCEHLYGAEREYVKKMSSYKKNISGRVSLMYDTALRAEPRALLRSYRTRLFLKLL